MKKIINILSSAYPINERDIVSFVLESSRLPYMGDTENSLTTRLAYDIKINLMRKHPEVELSIQWATEKIILFSHAVTFMSYKSRDQLTDDTTTLLTDSLWWGLLYRQTFLGALWADVAQELGLEVPRELIAPYQLGLKNNLPLTYVDLPPHMGQLSVWPGLD